MRRGPFLTEEELVEKHQAGKFGWVEYISHYSEEWCDEYEEFCKQNGYDVDDNAAAKLFVDQKNEELEQGEEE